MWIPTLAIAVFPLSPLSLAQHFESTHQWPQAHKIYAKLSLDRKIQLCQRRITQIHRQDDPHYQQWLATLNFSDSLQLIQQVIEHLSKRYPDGKRSTPKSLFDLGLDELISAFDDHGLAKRLIPAITREQCQAIRHELSRSLNLNTIRTTADLRLEIRNLVLSLSRTYSQINAVTIAMEFANGMCGGLDEFTTLSGRPAPAEPAPTIVGAMMLDPQVGYIRIAEFTESTTREFESATASLTMQGMKALIVDLRGNPGGLLAAGVEICKQLLPHGVILRTQGRDGDFAQRLIASQAGMMALPVKLVVLVDAETISTAEVVAKAIQSNGRGSLVGTPTYGKGTVQTTIELNAGKQSILVMTVATLVDNDGKSLVGQKIHPEHIEENRDLQLKAAIAEAKSQLSTMPD